MSEREITARNAKEFNDISNTLTALDDKYPKFMAKFTQARLSCPMVCNDIELVVKVVVGNEIILPKSFVVDEINLDEYYDSLVLATVENAGKPELRYKITVKGSLDGRKYNLVYKCLMSPIFSIVATV